MDPAPSLLLPLHLALPSPHLVLSSESARPLAQSPETQEISSLLQDTHGGLGRSDSLDTNKSLLWLLQLLVAMLTNPNRRCDTGKIPSV